MVKPDSARRRRGQFTMRYIGAVTPWLERPVPPTPRRRLVWTHLLANRERPDPSIFIDQDERIAAGRIGQQLETSGIPGFQRIHREVAHGDAIRLVAVDGDLHPVTDLGFDGGRTLPWCGRDGGRYIE